MAAEGTAGGAASSVSTISFVSLRVVQPSVKSCFRSDLVRRRVAHLDEEEEEAERAAGAPGLGGTMEPFPAPQLPITEEVRPPLNTCAARVGQSGEPGAVG